MVLKESYNEKFSNKWGKNENIGSPFMSFTIERGRNLWAHLSEVQNSKSGSAFSDGHGIEESGHF